MGGQQSSEVSAEGVEQGDLGFHVLKLEPDSPALIAGLEPYFDFIVGVNGQHLQGEESLLVNLLHGSLNKEVILQVYSSKTGDFREVVVVPTTYGGPGVLGASLRSCNYPNANETTWHILELQPNSPAAAAGLHSFTDYIIGTPEAIVSDPADLGILLERFDKKELRMYVYNSEDDDIRMVTLIPDSNWGGEGSLGCNIGSGLLHKIPTRPAQKASVQEVPSESSMLAQTTPAPVPPSPSPVPVTEIPPSPRRERPQSQAATPRPPSSPNTVSMPTAPIEANV
eukprot:comp15455_c0_seq1/m.12427 comp15455_c0_seq1/g.12427  ORF comp15455_c0_seq1/g.12427 comp15455_c0_seq1/m.12427 type:complete len:283 (-) comp15455_c0_seq1:316-1164(-)